MFRPLTDSLYFLTSQYKELFKRKPIKCNKLILHKTIIIIITVVVDDDDDVVVVASVVVVVTVIVITY